ncbi:MAG: DUF1837 domain-containing protein, partial [Sedimentisphaerales bacterium]|nr:DUF1837 domain-containing protein [Sedimentisphaerales bacterium]
TDYNMSVFGIDTLHYSSSKDLILFGESKLCKTISSGIALINKSLEEYEKQISDEFSLVLSERQLGKNKDFSDKFQDMIDECIDVKTFITKARIRKIGIPLFIAHGKEIDHSKIFSQLNKIHKKKILNLETIYYLISMPIIDKEKLVAIITQNIRNRLEELNAECN